MPSGRRAAGEQSGCEGNELTLPERKPYSALAELGLIAILELTRERVGADGLGCRGYVLWRGVRASERDVLAQRAGEEKALLGHDAELRA